jgi:hypothetical protein
MVGEETKTRKNGKQHGNSDEPAHTACGLALASLFRGKDGGRLSRVHSILHRSLLSHASKKNYVLAGEPVHQTMKGRDRIVSMTQPAIVARDLPKSAIR